MFGVSKKHTQKNTYTTHFFQRCIFLILKAERNISCDFPWRSTSSTIFLHNKMASLDRLLLVTSLYASQRHTMPNIVHIWEIKAIKSKAMFYLFDSFRFKRKEWILYMVFFHEWYFLKLSFIFKKKNAPQRTSQYIVYVKPNL